MNQTTAIGKADVTTLANMACSIDETKTLFTEQSQRNRLQQALALIHEVADEADRANDFGIYAPDEPTSPFHLQH